MAAVAAWQAWAITAPTGHPSYIIMIMIINNDYDDINGNNNFDDNNMNNNNQGCNARKVNCGRVYSAYILKPVFFGQNL